MYFDLEDERVVRAFVDCIHECGASAMSVDDVARKLGSSRAGLYRQFGSWRQLVVFGYEAMLEWVDHQFPRSNDDRRVQFEKWWTDIWRMLHSRDGKAVLAMRSLAAVLDAEQPIEDLERQRLTAMSRWCGTTAAPIRATWALLRTAASATTTDAERIELREIAWLLVGRDTGATDEEALDAIVDPLH
jgi:AcrR family transcriptional regulator